MSESDQQVLRDELIYQEIEHIDGEIAQLYALHHRGPNTCGHLIMHQIDEAIRQEGEYRSKNDD